MAKPFGVCALCKNRKFLNYAKLCKNCNKSDASSKIKGIALDQQDVAQASAKKEQAANDAAKKASAVEEEATAEAAKAEGAKVEEKKG